MIQSEEIIKISATLNELRTHYNQLAIQMKQLEGEVIKILASLLSTVPTPPQIEALNKLKENLDVFLLQNITIEESTRHLILTPDTIPKILSNDEAQNFHFQILTHHLFTFHTSNCLRHLLGETSLPDVWMSTNNAITKNFHLFYQRIYSNPKYELYLGSTIVLMLKEMLSQKLFLNDPHELGRIIKSHLFFCDFIRGINTVHLKIQCEIGLFMLEYEEIFKNKVQQVDLEKRPLDSQETSIIAHLNSLTTTTSDTIYYRFFANATKLLRHLLALQKKLSLYSKNPREAAKLNCSVNVKNIDAILKELVHLLDEFNLALVLQHIEDELNKPGRIDYVKILQTQDVLQYLLEVICRSLEIGLHILDHVLSESKDKQWKTYYDSLTQKKKLLEFQLKTNTLHQLICREDKNVDEKILASINGIDVTLNAMNLQIRAHESVEKKKEKKKRCQKERIMTFEDIPSQADETQANQLTQNIAETQDSPQSAPPKPTVLKIKIPLPAFFHHVRQILATQHIRLLVVGGYVRDHFQCKKANDIDAVMFDPITKMSGNDLLYKTLSLVKQHYPLSEIHGRDHSVLYIQGDNMIIEISCLKTANRSFKKRDLLFFYEDAVSRDTTDCALFYDPDKEIVIDFFNGINHIKENRLVTIAEPSTSFNKRPDLIFRVLRSIIKRSVDHPNLVYSNDIITAMQQHIKQLEKVNKARCFTEIVRLLFNGNASATWQFLTRYQLTEHFFMLPQNKELHFKHSLLILSALNSLDARIKETKSFHYSFTFSVLLWGLFCEQLDGRMTENHATEVANQVCADNRLLFSLPNWLIHEIRQIWLAHLNDTKQLVFQNYFFQRHHHVLASMLGRSIKRTSNLQNKTRLDGRNGFFHQTRLECIIKDIVTTNDIVYQYNNKIITLTHFNILLGKPVLKSLKHYLTVLFGSEQVDIENDETSLYISTDYINKKRAIDRLMDFVFKNDNDNPEYVESMLSLTQ